MSKQYFYIIFLVYVNIHFITSKEIPKPYVNTNVTTISVNKTENVKLNVTTSTNSIPSEGGGKMVIEHVVSSSSSTPASTIEKSIKNTTIPTIKHSSTTETIKPVSEAEEITGDSKVKPRKGVTFDPISTKGSTTSSTTTTTTTTTTKKPTTTSTTTTTTTTKVFIPHKPTVTISSEDDTPIKSPPKLFVNGKELIPKNTSNSSPKNIPDNEPIYISRRTEKGSDYVLPIVLLILSVPLLAIMLTVVYKRGKEWWHHRHYRRMDFLIDGMYNN